MSASRRASTATERWCAAHLAAIHSRYIDDWRLTRWWNSNENRSKDIYREHWMQDQCCRTVRDIAAEWEASSLTFRSLAVQAYSQSKSARFVILSQLISRTINLPKWSSRWEWRRAKHRCCLKKNRFVFVIKQKQTNKVRYRSAFTWYERGIDVIVGGEPNNNAPLIRKWLVWFTVCSIHTCRQPSSCMMRRRLALATLAAAAAAVAPICINVLLIEKAKTNEIGDETCDACCAWNNCDYKHKQTSSVSSNKKRN